MTITRPQLLLTLRGVAHAPVAAVADLLLDLRPRCGSPIMPPGHITRLEPADGSAYTATIDQHGSRVFITIDPITRSASIQGQWWYRADFTVTSHDDGCLITQQIFNVANRLRWAVRYVARKPLAASPHAFATILEAVHERLGCPTYPLF